MRQSLLAFLAMAIFSLLALSQQRVMMRHHSIVYGRDTELAAMNMVSDKLAELQTLSYDEVDETVDGINQRTTPDGLTSLAAFGLDADEEEIGILAASDIDDYHGYSTVETYTYNRAVYRFKWAVDVKYIDPDDLQLRASSTPTLAKLVTLTLEEDLPEGYADEVELGRPPIFVEFKKIFSPGGMTLH